MFQSLLFCFLESHQLDVGGGHLGDQLVFGVASARLVQQAVSCQKACLDDFGSQVDFPPSLFCGGLFDLSRLIGLPTNSSVFPLERPGPWREGPERIGELGLCDDPGPPDLGWLLLLR